jgi:DNA-binding response OmpR family regulator
MSDDRPTLHLIDPDPEVLMALFDTLIAEGFQTSASTRAREGLDYVLRVRPRIVLCHADMPDLKGAELAHQIQKVAPGTHVLLAVPTDDAALHDQLRTLEGVHLISRPYDIVELLDAVASCRTS